jgi:hypothetical protein
MTTWLQNAPETRVGFAERAHDIASFVREGVNFGLAARGLRITPDGGIEIGSAASPQRALREGDDSGASEVNDCLRRATFMGKWLARAGSTNTVFALLGIRP